MFVSLGGLKNFSWNEELDQHELMFIHTTLTDQMVSDWIEKTNPGFILVLFHLIWMKLETLLSNQVLYVIVVLPFIIALLMIQYRNKNQLGEVFMKDIIDALIFNHEVKIGRISSMNSLKKHISQDKLTEMQTQGEKKMSFWEKLRAPKTSVNLIKILNVIQESRQKDIQSQMKTDEDPFVAKTSSKKSDPIPDYYNFVNDLIKFESSSNAKKK